MSDRAEASSTHVAVVARVASGYRARLQIIVSGVPAGVTMSVARGSEAVLGGVSLPASSTVIDDAAMPLNADTSWTVRLSTGEQVAVGPLRLVSDWSILSSPHGGTFALVKAASRGSVTYANRTQVVPIEGARVPSIISEVELAGEYALGLRTYTLPQADAVVQVASLGGPLLMRYMCPDWPQVWLKQVGARTLYRYPGMPDCTHELQVMEIPLPNDTLRAKGDTLADLYAAAPIMDESARRWAAMADVSATDLKALL